MFGLFKKDPTAKLRKEFEQLSEKAMNAQRNGNIELFAKLTSEADEIYKKIENIEKEQGHVNDK
tara:strand:+ start:223741 stop:223932 length:192 start_codon:yes stop_codon:yes gene_type:complete